MGKADNTKKTERVEVRVSPMVKRTIERASALEGRSLSEFILSSAFEEAKRAIEEHERMVLSIRDGEAFVAALLNPPQPTDAARKAAKRYKQVLG